MSKQYIFIDDSGDTGLSYSNTDFFIVAAVIVVDEKEKDLLVEAINLFRQNLGWVELHEFKFNKTKKEILINLIDSIKSYKYSAYAVVLDKREIDINRIEKGKFSIYSHLLKELLLRVSKNDQVVTIDGRNSKKYDKKVRVYLRRHLKDRGILNSKFRFVDSRKDSLIQLADILAGAVASSYKGKSDIKVFFDILNDKIVKIEQIKI